MHAKLYNLQLALHTYVMPVTVVRPASASPASALMLSSRRIVQGRSSQQLSCCKCLLDVCCWKSIAPYASRCIVQGRKLQCQVDLTTSFITTVHASSCLPCCLKQAKPATTCSAHRIQTSSSEDLQCFHRAMLLGLI